MATFRSPFIRKDATRGSRPLDGRLSLAGLLTPSDDLGALPGVISGLAVSGIAGTWAYAVSAGHAVTSRGASDGANMPGLDGTTNTPTVAAAPSSGSRWDLIWIRQQDIEAADADSSSLLGVTQGTASGSPTKPYATVPAGALVLAEAQVGSGATGTLHANVVVTQVAKRVAARGGIVPTTSAAFGPGAYVGQYIDDPTLGLLRWTGTAWVAMAVPRTVTAVTPSAPFGARSGFVPQIIVEGTKRTLVGEFNQTGPTSYTSGTAYTLGTFSSADAPPASALFNAISKGTQATMTISAAGVISLTPTYTGTYATVGETVAFLDATWYR